MPALISFPNCRPAGAGSLFRATYWLLLLRDSAADGQMAKKSFADK